MLGHRVSPPPSLRQAIAAVAGSRHVSFVLDSNLRLAYCNHAWNEFAVANAAPELAGTAVLGTDLRSVIGEGLRPFYMSAFEKVARDGQVWECLYECSSPQVFRKFQMRIHPLAPAGWNLVTNSLVIERPHLEAVGAKLEDYRNADDVITVCMHCRCTRRSVPPDRWDFVPSHLERESARNISHGLCPVCLEYFYPENGDE